MIIYRNFNVTEAGIKETGFINFSTIPLEDIISPDPGVICLLYTKMIFCLKWFGKERIIQCLSSPGSQSNTWRTFHPDSPPSGEILPHVKQINTGLRICFGYWSDSFSNLYWGHELRLQDSTRAICYCNLLPV